jgi:triacylglycerol esterase/lipase EstA (alpha/beta hydrolase family)
VSGLSWLDGASYARIDQVNFCRHLTWQKGEVNFLTSTTGPPKGGIIHEALRINYYRVRTTYDQLPRKVMTVSFWKAQNNTRLSLSRMSLQGGGHLTQNGKAARSTNPASTTALHVTPKSIELLCFHLRCSHTTH